MVQRAGLVRQRIATRSCIGLVVFILQFVVVQAEPISLSHSLGQFEIRLQRFSNDQGRRINGECCARPQQYDADKARQQKQERPDEAGQQQQDRADEPGQQHDKGGEASVLPCPSSIPPSCRTYFRLCLSHYQADISVDGSCTMGVHTTNILGNNSFELEMGENQRQRDTNEENLIQFRFSFSWPGSYSLVIEAWDDDGQVHQEDNYKQQPLRNLIYRYAVQQFLSTNDSWSYTDWKNDARTIRLQFAYRVVCSKNQYGPGCDVTCVSRDDKFGHYRCNPLDGSYVCFDGWIGNYCNNAICSRGCNVEHGYCQQPNTCLCKTGWQGNLCDNCIRYPGCKQGTCREPFECNCNEGWGGQLCDEDLEFCIRYKPCMHGATCKNTGRGRYTCECASGFAGVNCEQILTNCTKLCRNQGMCKLAIDGTTSSRCECPPGFQGQHCEFKAGSSCHESFCSNGATCVSLSDSRYRCECVQGFSGAYCEIQIDDCLSQPCQNAGRCVDEVGSFHCICAKGFAGSTCQHNVSDCASTSCLREASTLIPFVQHISNANTTDLEGTSRQMFLFICLSIALILLLVIIVATLIFLNRQHRLPSQTQKNNKRNLRKYRKNVDIYPEDENTQISPFCDDALNSHAGKVNTEEIISLRDEHENNFREGRKQIGITCSKTDYKDNVSRSNVGNIWHMNKNEMTTKDWRKNNHHSKLNTLI